MAFGVEPQSSVDDVLGDVVEASAFAEGVPSKSDERLRDADVELGGHHPRRLVHDQPEIRGCVELCGELPWGGAWVCMMSSACAVRSAMTSASANCSSLKAWGRSQ